MYVCVISSILQDTVKPSDMLWIHVPIEYRDRLLHNPDHISSSVISQDTAPDHGTVIQPGRFYSASNHCKQEVRLLDIQYVPRKMQMIRALSNFTVAT